MDNVVGFIKSFFDDLKGLQKWLALMLLVVILMAGIQEYERLTGYFQLSKIERKIGILKELQSISDAGIDNHPELHKIYQGIVSDLTSFELSQSIFSNFLFFNLQDSVVIGKAISGASFLILVLIFGLSSDIKGKHVTPWSFIACALLLLSALVLGFIGTLIPTIYNPWINYLGFPLLQFGLIYFLAYRGKKS